jgi:long-chain acyl-CoA synthetase
MDVEAPAFLRDERLEKIILNRIASRMHAFPGYAKVYRIAVIEKPWTVDNELITPTLKLRRKRILDRYSEEIHRLYEGHEM